MLGLMESGPLLAYLTTAASTRQIVHRIYMLVLNMDSQVWCRMCSIRIRKVVNTKNHQITKYFQNHKGVILISKKSPKIKVIIQSCKIMIKKLKRQKVHSKAACTILQLECQPKWNKVEWVKALDKRRYHQRRLCCQVRSINRHSSTTTKHPVLIGRWAFKTNKPLSISMPPSKPLITNKSNSNRETLIQPSLRIILRIYNSSQLTRWDPIWMCRITLEKRFLKMMSKLQIITLIDYWLCRRGQASWISMSQCLSQRR